MRSQVKLSPFCRWTNWGLESSSDLDIVTRWGGGKAGIQPRSNNSKASTYQSRRSTLMGSQVWEPWVKASRFHSLLNREADQPHTTQFCRMSDLSWGKIITSHNVCNFSSWLFGYGCLKKPFKKCLAPKNTLSKLCNVASNSNLLGMECTVIMTSKVGAAQFGAGRSGPWPLLCPDLLGDAGQRQPPPTPTLPPLDGGASQGPFTFQHLGGSMTHIRTIRSPGKAPSMEFKNRLKPEHSNLLEKTGLWSFGPQGLRPTLSEVWYVSFPWNLRPTPDPLNKFLIGICQEKWVSVA